MASEKNLNAVFSDIANSIRSKQGTTDAIQPINMASEIDSIETGSIDTRFKEIVEGTITSIDDSTITTVKQYAFYMTESLVSVNLPNATLIDQYAFYHCTNLATVNIPNATRVTSYAFRLTKITNIVLPNVGELEREVFAYCRSLATIDCHKLTSIEYRALIGCSALKSLIIRTMDTIPPLNSSAFSECYHFYGTTNDTYNPSGAKDGAIYVPDDKVESLKTETNWSVFADIIKPLSEYVEE